MKRCENCHWSQWTVEKPPCKECQEVGAFHKWQEKKEFPKPEPCYIGHRDEWGKGWVDPKITKLTDEE